MSEGELRHLSYTHISQLGDIFSIQDQWKNLMSQIPSDLNDLNLTDRRKKFTIDQINLIEKKSLQCNKSAFEVLVEEWGTMGKKRPTLGHLLILCLECQATRAASYINHNILKGDEIVEVNESVLADMVHSVLNLNKNSNTTNFLHVEEELESLADESLAADASFSGALVEENSDFLTHPGPHENAFAVPKIPFEYLNLITEEFGKKDPARLIGSGGFASVYLGITSRTNKRLAIKKLKDSEEDPERKSLQFNYEVGELSRLKHKYIIQILAYSNDNPRSVCLVYQYYKNGTLESRLKCLDKATCLSFPERMKILVGVAEGLNYLHNLGKKMIHRDIKSSNILIDDESLPKIADFGLLRHASTNNTETVNIKGTPQYMAPESFHGDISEKVDVYSFGVVILEVLTGLGIYIVDHTHTAETKYDLLTFVEEKLEEAADESCEIPKLFDEKVEWPLKTGLKLFEISQKCRLKKSKRPLMSEVLKELSQFSS